MKKIKFIYRAYRFRYKIDPEEIAYIRKSLRPGNVAIDIGSHKGGYLYWFKKGVGDTGMVFGFEPQLPLFHYLKDIIQTFGYTNVTLENKGLSSKEGKVAFFVPKTKKGTSPGARIDHLEDETQYDESEIEITTLDKYFLERKIFPDFIKVDVEGHEKQVLLGGIQLFKACMPTLIIECEKRHLGEDSIFDVFKILTDIGYQGYFFKDKQMRPLSEFDIETHQKMGEGRFWEAKGYINNFVFEPPK